MAVGARARPNWLSKRAPLTGWGVPTTDSCWVAHARRRVHQRTVANNSPIFHIGCKDGGLAGLARRPRKPPESRAQGVMGYLFRSVMSWWITDAPTIAPSSSRIGETLTETGISPPSLRTRMVSRRSMC